MSKKINFLIRLKAFWNIIYVLKYTWFMKKEAYVEAYLEISKINKDVVNLGLYRFRLDKGYLAFKLRNYEESRLLFEESISVLNIAYSKNIVSSDERDYFKEYAFGYLIIINKVYKEFTKVDLYTKELQKLDYDIKKIKNVKFYDFPLLIGDKWDKEKERR